MQFLIIIGKIGLLLFALSGVAFGLWSASRSIKLMRQSRASEKQHRTDPNTEVFAHHRKSELYITIGFLFTLVGGYSFLLVLQSF